MGVQAQAKLWEENAEPRNSADVEYTGGADFIGVAIAAGVLNTGQGMVKQRDTYVGTNGVQVDNSRTAHPIGLAGWFWGKFGRSNAEIEVFDRVPCTGVSAELSARSMNVVLWGGDDLEQIVYSPQVEETVSQAGGVALGTHKIIESSLFSLKSTDVRAELIEIVARLAQVVSKSSCEEVDMNYDTVGIVNFDFGEDDVLLFSSYCHT